MKKYDIHAIFLLTILLSSSVCQSEEQTLTNAFRTINSNPLQQSKMLFGVFREGQCLELYTEISHDRCYIGDTVYLEISAINRDICKMTISPSRTFKSINNMSFLIDYSRSYQVFIEGPDSKRFCLSGERIDITDGVEFYLPPPTSVLPPGHKRNYLLQGIQIPSLHDASAFNEFFNAYKAPVVTCKMFICVSGITCFDGQAVEFVYDISIMRRNQKEERAINQMYENTPVKHLPQPGFCTKKSNDYPRKSLPFAFKSADVPFLAIRPDDIIPANWSDNRLGKLLGTIQTIGGPMPLTLVRPFDVRKPGPPLAPKTPEGWKELESQFENGTLKDELKMTRLLAEFYNLEQEQQIYEKQQEIILWLNSLPKLQARVLAQFVHRTDNEKLKVRSESIYEKLKMYRHYGHFEDVLVKPGKP